jgi:hypothetical protein
VAGFFVDMMRGDYCGAGAQAMGGIAVAFGRI